MSKDFGGALKDNGKFVVAVSPKDEMHKLFNKANTKVSDCFFDGEKLNNTQFLKMACELIIGYCEAGASDAKRRLELVRDCRLNNTEFLKAALELVVADCECKMREKLREVGVLK